MGLARKNRWAAVFGSTVGLTFGVAPLLFQSFGVFLKPIAAEFGASRAAVAAALGVGNLGLIIGTPIAGKLVDRWGARSVIAGSITLLSLATASLWLSHSVLSFVLLFGLAAFLGSGQTGIAHAEILSAWFDSRRGLALGIAMAGIGLGATMLPPVSESLIVRSGWRATYVALAVLSFLIAQSALLLLIRPPKGFVVRHRRTAEQAQLPGATAQDARKSGIFWLLAASMFLVVMATVGTTVHLVPLLTDHGVSRTEAAAVLSVVGLSQIIGRLGAGYCVDRFHAPRVAAVFFMAPIPGLVILAVSTSGSLAFAAAAVIGLSLGAEMNFMAFMVSRYFGLKAYGEIFGYLFAIFNVGAAVGPVAMAAAFDLTRSYHAALVVFGISFAMASFLITRVGAYRFPGGEALLAKSSVLPPPQVGH